MDVKEDLMQHISQFNIYDLERLLQCFQYEATYRTGTDLEDVNEIISCIESCIEKVNATQ